MDLSGMKAIIDKFGWQKLATWLALGFCGLISLLAFYWDHEPKLIDVNAHIEQAYPDAQFPVGAYSALSLSLVIDKLISKRGGFISNDAFFPGVWMDNTPNWEQGVLSEVRIFADMLHDHWSLQNGDEDMDVATADSRLLLKHTAWQFPSAESEYLSAAHSIDEYLARLNDEKEPAKFNANKKNLQRWLVQVESQLGGLIAHLNAANVTHAANSKGSASDDSVRDNRVVDEESQASQVGGVQSRTSWLEIDDYFYQARGSAWALIHFFTAVEKDHSKIFSDPENSKQLHLALQALNESQQTLWSPMILNGDGMGVLANHSLVMSAYLTRAKVAIQKLREQLNT